MNKKVLIFVFAIALIVVPFVSANYDCIGTFKISDEMEITNYCEDATCTYMNLTSIELPNNTILYLNAEMTNNNQHFNYTYTPEELGTYHFTTKGNPGGYQVSHRDYFEVTNTGEEKLTTGSSITLIIGLVVMFLVAGLLLVLANRINNGTIITILYGISVIILFMATLFSMTLIDNILGNYENIVKGYSSFVMVFKILLSMSVLGLTLYAGLKALKMYKMKRGLVDEN